MRLVALTLGLLCVLAGTAYAEARPGVPTIESTDFPDGEPVLLARTTGTVTLRPSSVDDDVVAYLYGVQQDRVTSRIKADADGTAVLPITVHDDLAPTAMLFVKVVNRAGAISDRSPGWGLSTFDNPAPRIHERGDTTGDGRADVAVVLGNTAVWNFTARAGGFYTGVRAIDLPVTGVKHVRGDFDGDGRDDIAVQRGGSDVFVFRGGALGSPAVWGVIDGRLVAGDFDGDQRADLAGTRAGGLYLHRSTGTGFAAGERRWCGTVQGSLTAGDVDGDDTDEIIAVSGGGIVVFDDFRPRRWAGGIEGTPSTGDFDLDGRDDLAVMGTTELWTFRSTGTAFADRTLVWRVDDSV